LLNNSSTNGNTVKYERVINQTIEPELEKIELIVKDFEAPGED